jgi:hypothetical protein
MKSHSLLHAILALSAPLFFGIPAYAQSVDGGEKFNPYLPGVLNEYALESVRSGDLYGAQIFLERANRLNPLSPDIQSNLEIVRKLRVSKGEVEVRNIDIGESGASNQSTDDAGALPALWPKL